MSIARSWKKERKKTAGSMAMKILLASVLIAFAVALMIGPGRLVPFPLGLAHFFHLNFPPAGALLPVVDFSMSGASTGATISERFFIKYSGYYDIGIYCGGEQASDKIKFSGHLEVTVSLGQEVLSRREIVREKARYFGPNKFTPSDLIVLDTLPLKANQGTDAYLVSIAVIESSDGLLICNGQIRGFIRASQRP
jgi:hypothetical protein